MLNLSDLSQFVRNSARFRDVLTILAKYGLAGWLKAARLNWVQELLRDVQGEPIAGQSVAARIRLAFTELGTTWIKFGQVLSTRPDLVGSEVAEELARLRDSTPPHSAESTRETIEAELGESPDKLFRTFEDEPMASASIGQVHRAVLLDGAAVVVKVQHPGIEESIRNDLEILARLAALAEQYSAQLRQYRPVETAAEFKRTLLNELDFRREQRSLNLFAANFRGDDGIRFPATYPDLSSRRVLTMELFRGISVSDAAGLRAASLDLEDLARRGARMFVDMIFRDGFYHADPHPGNLMVLVESSGRGKSRERRELIGVIDCGMVGRVDDELRAQFERAMIAAVRVDSRRLTEIVSELGVVPEEFDQDVFRFEVEEFLVEYGDQSIDEFDLAGCLRGLISLIRQHRIILPSRVAMLLKVLIMLEGTAQQLSPRFSLAELMQDYSVQATRRRLSPKRLLRRMEVAWHDWDKLIEILPRDLADILHNVKRGRFDVHLDHRRLDSIVNRLVLGILSAALFMGSASLLSNNVPPLVGGMSVLGAAGCLVALYFGFTLLRAIKSSGDIRNQR